MSLISLVGKGFHVSTRPAMLLFFVDQASYYVHLLSRPAMLMMLVVWRLICAFIVKTGYAYNVFGLASCCVGAIHFHIVFRMVRC